MTHSQPKSSKTTAQQPLPLQITTEAAAKQFAAVMFPKTEIYASWTGSQLGAYDPNCEMGLLVLHGAAHEPPYATWADKAQTMFKHVATVSASGQHAHEVKAKVDQEGRRRLYDSVQFTQAPCLCRTFFGGDAKLGRFTSAT